MCSNAGNPAPKAIQGDYTIEVFEVQGGKIMLVNNE